MRIKPFLLIVFIFFIPPFVLSAVPTYATELSIPEIQAKAGQTIDVPLMIDAVDNLAGIKIVIQYDKKFLTYKNGVRTKYTSSLMHIVNDKKPGSLVVVMAGARGIKGKQFSIFSLTFETAKSLKKEIRTTLKITETQLMSDQLKDIKHTVKIAPIVLKP